MGQILDRVFRIAKSYSFNNDISSSSSHSESSDEELRRIIYELKKEATRKDATNQKSNDDSKSKVNDNIEIMNLERALKTLNINANTSNEEVKAAYIQKIKEYHPDRVASLGKELIELAIKKTQEINQAYDYMKKYKGII